MIGGLRAKENAEKIRGIMTNFNKRKNEILENNRTDFIKAMGIGAVMPSSVKLNDHYREEATKLLKNTREQLSAIMTPLINDVLNTITEAPTEEAVRMIDVVRGRTNISADEIDYLMNRYGNNVQVYNALHDIAKSHEYYDFKQNGYMKQLSDFQKIEKYFDKFNCYDIDNGNLTDTGAMLVVTYFEDATDLEHSEI